MKLALIRNWLMACLRGMAASPVQSAIAIGSLAIGLWAAILAGLIVVNQTGYDKFIPGSRQLYLMVFHEGGRNTGHAFTPPDLVVHLRAFPEVRDTSRLAQNRGTFTRDGVNAREEFYWADPNFFRVMPLPALFGDPATALERPDGLVLTRAMARKYFGRDDARGGIVLLDHKTAFTVRAVIEDLPVHASNLEDSIFASGLSPVSSLSPVAKLAGMSPTNFTYSVMTLVRLADGADPGSLNDKVTAVVAGLFKGATFAKGLTVESQRLDEIPLSPLMHPASRERLKIFIAISALLLLLACLNFISLSLARSVRRAVEVGIRKATGAGRATLIVQFLGESIVQALLALCAAMALVEWTLPLANGFMQSGAVFPWWRDPALIAAMLGGATLVGTLAGVYPAFFLAAFRPAPVLKGMMLRASRLGAHVRQGLVALQFAIPLALVIAAAVVFQQNRFAASEALHLDTDRMLMVNLPACGTAIDAEMAALPGVAGAACTGPSLLPNLMFLNKAKARDGHAFDLMLGEVGFGFFQLYHLPAIAGRLPDPAHPGDAVPVRQLSTALSGPLSRVRPPGPRPPRPPKHFIINEEAVKALGYASPAEAIGKPLPTGDNTGDMIIGVVRDFSLYPPMEKTRPTAYQTATDAGGTLRGIDAAALHLRLKGGDIAPTLAAIDAVWKRHSPDPISRIFLDDFARQQQIAEVRQGQAFALFAAVAALLACLGLFGLSLSAVERRTKEIGVRKAMGADSADVLRLLLWQFSQPVLLANLIAWPLAWWLMRHWLAEFPYHIELSWWLFVGASGLTLLIALATVAAHALGAARQKPVLALRYE